MTHSSKRRRSRTLATAALAGTVAAAASASHGDDPALSRLSLEELSNLEVTSVSKRAEPLSDAPTSVFVITADDIRRSGAASLPELLRLAPNLHVARASASGHAISARGFNGTAANKLLVLIDGRSVYTPLFSGVFWDVQDLMLQDIERIEVISGPGGTLWGTNAVNGVINVISRSARETKGTLVSAAAGNRDAVLAARHAAALGSDGLVGRALAPLVHAFGRELLAAERAFDVAVACEDVRLQPCVVVARRVAAHLGEGRVGIVEERVAEDVELGHGGWRLAQGRVRGCLA
jgi:iron complex outermembrane receptor protein